MISSSKHIGMQHLNQLLWPFYYDREHQTISSQMPEQVPWIFKEFKDRKLATLYPFSDDGFRLLYPTPYFITGPEITKPWCVFRKSNILLEHYPGSYAILHTHLRQRRTLNLKPGTLNPDFIYFTPQSRHLLKVSLP